MREEQEVALMAASILGGYIAKTGPMMSVNLDSLMTASVNHARALRDKVRQARSEPSPAAPPPSPKMPSRVGGL